MKTISHLVAVSNDLVIGVDNDLPWNLKDDLAHFKKYTLNKIIIMGRKTYESIGRPLPNRINYVISRTVKQIDGAYVFDNLDDAMVAAEKHNNPSLIYYTRVINCNNPTSENTSISGICFLVALIYYLIIAVVSTQYTHYHHSPFVVIVGKR